MPVWNLGKNCFHTNVRSISVYKKVVDQSNQWTNWMAVLKLTLIVVLGFDWSYLHRQSVIYWEKYAFSFWRFLGTITLWISILFDNCGGHGNLGCWSVMKSAGWNAMIGILSFLPQGQQDSDQCQYNSSILNLKRLIGKAMIFVNLLSCALSQTVSGHINQWGAISFLKPCIFCAVVACASACVDLLCTDMCVELVLREVVRERGSG